MELESDTGVAPTIGCQSVADIATRLILRASGDRKRTSKHPIQSIRDADSALLAIKHEMIDAYSLPRTGFKIWLGDRWPSKKSIFFGKIEPGIHLKFKLRRRGFKKLFGNVRQPNTRYDDT